MDLLIVRHAIAELRNPETWPDDRDRPLTTAGKRRFRDVTRGLAQVVSKVDGVWSSPLRRAWETAEILQKIAGWPAPQELSALEPEEAPAAVLTHLNRKDMPESIVLVGHEPQLHELVSLCMGGSPTKVAVEMKKGGATLLRFDAPPKAGGAQLLWHLPPRVILELRK